MGKPRCFKANYLTRGSFLRMKNDPPPGVGKPTWRPAQRCSSWRVFFCSRSRTMLALQSSPKLDGWGKELQPYTQRTWPEVTPRFYLIHMTGLQSSYNYFSFHKQGNGNTVFNLYVKLSEVISGKDFFFEIISSHGLLLK